MSDLAEAERRLREHADLTTPFWRDVHVVLAELDRLRAVADPCRTDGKCCASTGICGSLTIGSGELDFNGYWEHPCPSCELRLLRKMYPDAEEKLERVRDEASELRSDLAELRGGRVFEGVAHWHAETGTDWITVTLPREACESVHDRRVRIAVQPTEEPHV